MSPFFSLEGEEAAFLIAEAEGHSFLLATVLHLALISLHQFTIIIAF
jgi:hypothetical protein